LSSPPNCPLSADFFKKLLSLPTDAVTPAGVRIVGAIFDDENLDYTFPNIKVPYEVRFERCVFSAPLNLSRANFLSSLSFTDSAFRASVSFDGVQVAGLFNLSGANFSHALVANQAVVGGNLVGSGATFHGPASFQELKVGRTLIFDSLENRKTVFHKNVNWSGAQIENNALLSIVEFKERAGFDGVSIGGSHLDAILRFFRRDKFWILENHR